MKIYLIDDELIVIKTIQGFLRDLGNDVTSFNSITEFLGNGVCNAAPADVIIVDLKMPREDAVRIISEIHTRYPNTDIVVMSSILPFHEAISHSVYSYLKKPIHFDELELILARISERHIGIRFDLQTHWKRV